MENLSPKEFNKACFANASFISRSIRNPKIRNISNSTHPTKLNKKCNITFVKELCIFPYFEMLNKGLHPLLLNIGNELIPGGEVLGGILGKEEYLCSISSLYVGLRIANDEGLYPIKRPFILDNVIFFKDKPTTSAKDILTTFYEGSVIVSSPLTTEDKIKELLDIAANNGFRNLILGNVKNKEIFEHYLKETDIGYYFENIVFIDL